MPSRCHSTDWGIYHMPHSRRHNTEDINYSIIFFKKKYNTYMYSSGSSKIVDMSKSSGTSSLSDSRLSYNWNSASFNLHLLVFFGLMQTQSFTPLWHVVHVIWPSTLWCAYVKNPPCVNKSMTLTGQNCTSNALDLYKCVVHSTSLWFVQMLKYHQTYDWWYYLLGGWGPVPGRHESLQFINVN